MRIQNLTTQYKQQNQQKEETPKQHEQQVPATRYPKEQWDKQQYENDDQRKSKS